LASPLDAIADRANQTAWSHVIDVEGGQGHRAGWRRSNGTMTLSRARDEPKQDRDHTPQRESEMRVRGLFETHLTVTDLERSVIFYHEVVGPSCGWSLIAPSLQAGPAARVTAQ
jgi:hypothetical protein